MGLIVDMGNVLSLDVDVLPCIAADVEAARGLGISSFLHDYASTDGFAALRKWLNAEKVLPKLGA